MAKKRKKISFWGVAAISLVTIAATLGAVKLFGVPSALKPEGEIHLKVVNKIEVEDIIDDSIFYTTTTTMDQSYLTENYEYKFEDSSFLNLKVVNAYTDTIEVEDYSFASEHKLGQASGANTTTICYYGDKLTYLRINYINNDKEEVNKLLISQINTILTPGSINHIENFVNTSSKTYYLNMFYISNYADVFEEDAYREILNFEFLANLDSEENTTREDVETEVKSVAKVDFRNSKKGTAVEADEFIEMMNEDEDIITGIWETTQEDVTTQYYENVTLNQGGLMIGDLDATDGQTETGKISWNFDETFEFDIIKMTVKGLELEDEKDGYEATSSSLIGVPTNIYCDSNALDTSVTSEVNEVYFMNTKTTLSFQGFQCPVILEIEFFSIEEIK